MSCDAKGCGRTAGVKKNKGSFWQEMRLNKGILVMVRLSLIDHGDCMLDDIVIVVRIMVRSDSLLLRFGLDRMRSSPLIMPNGLIFTCFSLDADKSVNLDSRETARTHQVNSCHRKLIKGMQFGSSSSLKTMGRSKKARLVVIDRGVD
ncbi:hypothetical protein CC2G_014737 [Coprinopsis cinerea AmutBmut pab1-1]|nr:hypothetical protein CC2G_014737 [Coprinopsis cinerea AmutBmut pab1-1]